MRNLSEICYMCDAPATSREHVPPRCIFPAQKDLPHGVDLRINLLSVPSCEAHNSEKSHDDEYFLYILGGSFQINEVGRNLYRTKIRRAIKRNASVLGKFASTAEPVNFIAPLSVANESSLAFKLDANRFNTLIDRLARAIYFCHFKEKWTYNIKYQAEFLFATTNQADEANLRINKISIQADKEFSNSAYFGENPGVFKYQVLENDDVRTMRLHFYEGCKLLLIFDLPTIAR